MHIVVKGIRGSGKSILIYELKEFLKSKGINVIYDPEPDYDNIEAFDDRMKNKHIDLNTIISTVEITEVSTYE